MSNLLQTASLWLGQSISMAPHGRGCQCVEYWKSDVMVSVIKVASRAVLLL